MEMPPPDHLPSVILSLLFKKMLVSTNTSQDSVPWALGDHNDE